MLIVEEPNGDKDVNKSSGHDVLAQSLTNTCGELERAVKSRDYNAIEALAMMAGILVVLWLIIYPFGELMKIETANYAGHILLGLGATMAELQWPLSGGRHNQCCVLWESKGRRLYK